MLSPVIHFFRFLEKTLQQPRKVFYICLSVLFISLVADGTLYQLWTLSQNLTRIGIKKEELNRANAILSQQIQKVSDPKFLEYQAMSQLNLVEKDDLIFIFSNPDSDEDSEPIESLKSGGEASGNLKSGHRRREKSKRRLPTLNAINNKMKNKINNRFQNKISQNSQAKSSRQGQETKK